MSGPLARPVALSSFRPHVSERLAFEEFGGPSHTRPEGAL